MARSSKKWQKKCRKAGLSAKMCKKLGRDELRGRSEGRGRPKTKIKACKKSDLGVRATVRAVHNLKESMRNHVGAGSGAEDWLGDLVDSHRRSLEIRCGKAFTRRALKIKL
jgi:hypothetical protein